MGDGAGEREALLADLLQQGLGALREGRAPEAAAALAAVCDDPELLRAVRDPASGMAEIWARASSLCAEALLGADRPADALRRADAALAVARRLGDTEGIDDIERLKQRIAATAPDPTPRVPDRERTLLLKTDLASIEAAHPDPGARGETLLRKAIAELEAGHPQAATEAADRAMVASSEPRIAVLARLTRARAEPDRAAEILQAALDLARDADAHTLVGAVVRAAEAAGVGLDTEVGRGR